MAGRAIGGGCGSRCSVVVVEVLRVMR
jgi:hypothetical protein